MEPGQIGDSVFKSRPPRFEEIQRFLNRAKIIIVEVASTISLLILLYQGLKLELKW